MILTAGQPKRPFAFTSQPASLNTAWRAAARQVKCASWQPEVNANEASSGRPNNSFSHAPAISSTTAAAGPHAYNAAFWSQADVIQSAASAEGSDPPITHAKNLPLAHPS